MGRATKNGLWIDTSGSTAAIGITADVLSNGKLTKVETLNKGSKVGRGEALVLLTFGKKKEIELESPVKGRVAEIRPELARAVTAVDAIAGDPEQSWILKVTLDASERDEEEEEDDEDVDLDDLDDEDA